jgi:glycosyltransferase involved in cell wall biosynthesis
MVSIIIPTHNRLEMLKRALESISNQTYQDLEIIVISDGSIDGTNDYCRTIKDDRFRFLEHKISKGASAARNSGIHIAEGNYIAFLDDDDEWLPVHLELLVAKFESCNNEVGLVYGWIDYYNGSALVQQKHPCLKGDIFNEMLDKQAITNSSVLLVRKEVVNFVHGFNEDLPRGNDGDFIRRIAQKFHVDYVPQVLAKIYVGHNDRISVNNRKGRLNEIIAYEKRLAYFKDDFDKYPYQKGNVEAKLVVLCIATWQIKKSIYYLYRVFQNKIPTMIKIKLAKECFLGVSKNILRPIINTFR